MDPANHIAAKRKHAEGPSSRDPLSLHKNPKASRATFSSSETPSAEGHGSAAAESACPKVLAQCQKALKSPAASRAVLIKYRTRIIPALAETLRIVSGYQLKVVFTVHRNYRLLFLCLLNISTNVSSRLPVLYS
jgi:hypothetical protein